MDMRQSILFAVACWAVVVVARADEAFSRTLRSQEFSAAGLGKLSPEELARLDALVRVYKDGTPAASGPTPDTRAMAEQLAAAQRQAEAAAQARAAAEAKAARAEAETQAMKAEATAKAEAAAKEKKSEPSLLARAKVLLTPGTEIEYTTVESRIKGDFRGWEGRAVFTLENGQRWQIANGGQYSTPAIPSPAVKIVPASLGGFWMTIEGMSGKVKVLPFGAK